MHYLVVSPAPMYPAVGGNRSVVLSMVRQIKAAGHRVSFLYSIQEDISNATNLQMMQEVDAFYLTAYSHMARHDEHNKAIVRMIAQQTTMNYGLDSWYDDDISAMVKYIYEKDPFDVIVSNYIWMSKVFEAVPAHVIKIQQTHDAMGNRLQKLAKLGLPPSFFSVTLEDEGRGLDRADINIALQYSEEMYFRTLTQSVVCTAQHAVKSLPFAAQKPIEGRKLRIGFVGSENHLNIKTIKSFVDVLANNPAVAERLELHVIGTVGHIFKVAPPFIKVVGVCPDLGAAFASMDVMINPMLDGTGLKIKSVEALQHHRPIIMTLAGSEGLRTPYHFHRCKNNAEVLGYIKLVLDNPGLLTMMQQAGEQVWRAYAHRLALTDRYLTDPATVLAARQDRLRHSHQVMVDGRSMSFLGQATSTVFPDAEVWAELRSVLKPEAVWLDLSAAGGELLFAALVAGVAGRVIPMEADERNLDNLKDNAFANNLQDKVDWQLMGYVAHDAPSFGEVVRDSEGRTSPHVVEEGNEAHGDQAVIPFIVLDQFMNTASRLDVIVGRGNSLAGLRGLEQTVKKHRPLIFIRECTSADHAAMEAWAEHVGYGLSLVPWGSAHVVKLSPR